VKSSTAKAPQQLKSIGLPGQPVAVGILKLVFKKDQWRFLVGAGMTRILQP
jgi:hypothetical protein